MKYYTISSDASNSVLEYNEITHIKKMSTFRYWNKHLLVDSFFGIYCPPEGWKEISKKEYDILLVSFILESEATYESIQSFVAQS